eukprot:TRINITY_DN10369_c0_g1_i3.p1 TRINITY_DN10369_c0_g1~~TRINITY_DN10369_c0_g1_i3.p1  ORF type:complete len:441 (+),score=151.99 TRINITY_DN10369_c0_g1_i3:64-1386(+)
MCIRDRYKKCSVPEEVGVYPLEKMKDVKKLTSSSGAKYYYFEFYCGMRYQLCSRSERIVNLWVKYLNSAIIYTSFLNSLKRVIESPETSESLKALNRELLESTLKVSQEEIELEESTSNQYKSEEDKKVFSLTKKVGFSCFKLLEKIGSGAFGSVFKVSYNPTGAVYAMKAISKRYLFRTNQQKYALSEAQMLKIVSHPFIIKLHFAFRTPRYLYFILDYCNCGDMAMHIARKVVFKEAEARFYVAELILAVEYLHSLDIVYRDLKPENLLIGSLRAKVDSEGHLRLSDFGLAKQTQGQSLSFCGSLFYLSPEMVMSKSSSKSVDIYGIGTILYEMLSGFPPFYNEDQEKMLYNIQFAKLQIPKYISSKAESVLKALLERDPAQRITLVELKRHSFFEGMSWEDVLNKKVKPPFDVESLEETARAYLTSRHNKVTPATNV